MMPTFEDLLNSVNFTTVLVFVITVVVIYWITYRPHGFPPGPQRLPVVGNLLSLAGQDTVEIMADLRKRYGDVYGLYIGSEFTVVLNGYDVINEAMLKRGKTFAYRPETEIPNKEIVFANGQLWKTNRSFLMQAFRNLCFLNRGEMLENYILEELKSFEQRVNKLKQPFYPGPYLNCSFAKVMFQICHGYSISHDDIRFKRYLDTVEKAFRTFTYYYTMQKCFPSLISLLVRPAIQKQVINFKQYFSEVCEENFRKHQSGDRSCLVDMLLEPDSPITKDRIWQVLHELMSAGSETSASAMTWFFLLIAMYPEKQKKLRMAIRNSIGSDLPSLTQRSKIPYVEATILECLRIGNVVPLSVPRAVAEDVMFRGYLISKGSVVLTNQVSVHLDAERFPDPLMFRPERFLSDDEMSIVNADRVIPFSSGPRSCLGETLARSELFMYVVYFIQKYDIVLTSDPNISLLKGQLDLTRKPQQYEVEFLELSTKDTPEY